MNKIITISREFGSGGREIGRRLAEEMKIAYYDQEIVAALIKRTQNLEDYIRYMEKERPLPLLPITTARTFGLSTNHAVTENLNFYMQESKIIREAAEKSDCVIVGRCADYVLRDMNPIRLFIYADMEYKIARCKAKGNEIENLAGPELQKKIVSIDKKRSRYYQFYTNQTWGKMEHYDLCINTSRYAQIKKIIPGLTALLDLMYQPIQN